jgi:hypothetical protein
MGLDMYLTARRTFWDFLDDGVGARKVFALFPELPEDTDTSGTAVSVKFGYWRKVYAIHNWFVRNVQNGEDNCQEFWVSPEDLQKLLDTVNDVLADMSKAPELLPPREGFFSAAPISTSGIGVTLSTLRRCSRKLWIQG